MVYLYGPAAVMIMMNIVFFLTTTLQLYRAREESALALRNHVSNQQLIRQRYILDFVSMKKLHGILFCF